MIFFFYSKKLISWEKNDSGNGQKRDFDPPTELTKGGRGAKIWLRGYFGKGNLSFEWVPYTMIRNDSLI